MKSLIFTLFSFFILSGCNPLHILWKEIRKSGYIEYKTPLKHSGPGTIIGGSPKKMKVLAPPKECFPDNYNGEETKLRFYDYTTLPSKTINLTANGKVGLDLLSLPNIDGGLISAGVSYDIVKTISLKLEGVHIEYFNGPKLTSFYLNHMDEVCKDYLDFSGFIYQAIKVNKLSYTFYDEQGANIELDLEKLKEILDIDLGLNFKIERNLELVFETPHYIGFQLGRLKREDNGLNLYRSVKTKGNKWIWENLNLYN